MENEQQSTSTVAPAPKKYELARKFEVEEKLRIWFMAIIPVIFANNIPLPSGQNPQYVGVIAYNHDAAVKRAKEVYGNPGVMIQSFEDNTLIETILQAVNFEGVELIHPEIATGPVLPLDKFRSSLLMAASEYIKNEKDKKVLERIILTLSKKE